MSDGETMERLWSFLRRFGRMTKEMRPSHRIDVLSSALVYYGIQTKDKLGNSRQLVYNYSHEFQNSVQVLCFLQGWKEQ